MKSLFNKSYDLLEIRKFKFLITFGGSIFIFIFLWIFEPFGIHTLNQLQKLYSLTLYSICNLVVWLVHVFLLQDVVLKKMTIANTIFWLTWIVFVLGICNFVVGSLLYPENIDKFSYVLFIAAQLMTITVAIIPISIIILFHYSFILKKRLEKAEELNKVIKNRSNLNDNKHLLSIESNNSRDCIEIYLDSLLFITSADNYIDIHYLKNKTLTNKLIRNTLSNIEDYFSNIPEIIRCHKSFIVNLCHVKSINGNSAGYKLQLNNIDFSIPVSRRYNKTILNVLRHIN